MIPLDLIPLRIPKDSSAEACICALSEGKCYKYFKYTTESLYDYTIRIMMQTQPVMLLVYVTELDPTL